MNILIPYFVFVLNWFPVAQPPDMVINRNIFQTDVTIGATFFEMLTIEGQTKTSMMQGDLFNYMPLQDEFYIRGFLEYKGFSIGIEHACFHPIETDVLVWQFEGGHDKVFFKFDSRGLDG